MQINVWKASVLAIASFGLGATTLAVADGHTPKELVLVPAGEAKFTEVDPRIPHGPQAAILTGDPRTGPVAFLLKIPKGVSPLHWHTSDYYAITVQGTTKHYVAGKAAEAKANKEGTYWFQPGGSEQTAHTDECLTDGGCTAFIYMPGKLDLKPIAKP